MDFRYLIPLAHLDRPTLTEQQRPLDDDRRITIYRNIATHELGTRGTIPEHLAEPVNLRVPGARRLADVLVRPLLTSLGWEIFDANSAAVPVGERAAYVRRNGSDGNPRPLREHEQYRLADKVLADLAAIDLDSEPWRTSYYVPAMVLIAIHAPDRMRSVVVDAVANAWRIGEPWRPVRPAAAAAPRKRDEAEHKRRQRARRYWRRDLGARWALARILADPERYFGEIDGQIAAPDLWEAARALVDRVIAASGREYFDWIRIADRIGWPEDDDGEPLSPVPLARNAFYEVADEMLGARVRGTAGVRFYVLPELAVGVADNVPVDVPVAEPAPAQVGLSEAAPDHSAEPARASVLPRN